MDAFLEEGSTFLLLLIMRRYVNRACISYTFKNPNKLIPPNSIIRKKEVAGYKAKTGWSYIVMTLIALGTNLKGFIGLKRKNIESKSRLPQNGIKFAAQHEFH